MDPRENSPRPEITIEKLLAVCDWIETEDFQRKSSTNKNREKIPFNHTCGKTSFVSKYKKMAEKSKIELFRNTHVNKVGDFVNSKAAEAYNKMTELEEAALEEGAAPIKYSKQLLDVDLGIRMVWDMG